MLQILREPQACARLACKRTKFRSDYRFNTATIQPDDPASGPHVPGTQIPRLKPIALGVRNIGYLSTEIDKLIAALADLRDAAPVRPRITRMFVRDALPRRLEAERKELLQARAVLRAKQSGDADPEIKELIEKIDQQLQALETR
jgi:hypothetical protein